MARDVEEFLSALGLARYLDAFVHNDVDHDLLVQLTDADLRELGVEKLGHRKRILAAATALRHGPASTGQPAPRVQRRQLTLMFADLVGSTGLSNRLGLEAYRDVIQRYQICTTDVVETCGGYVAKHYGDGTLAYFGYPQSHEDDVERAIRAGVTLAERVRGLDPGLAGPLEIRVGIETGPVVVGELTGEGAAREHAALGSTPNLAARLQAIAEPGAVVIGPTTRRLADGVASFEALGRHAVKGFPDPIEA